MVKSQSTKDVVFRLIFQVSGCSLTSSISLSSASAQRQEALDLAASNEL